jgi:DNA-binding XRE family transcriptional regulator
MKKLEHMLIDKGIKKGWLAKQVGIAPGTLSNIFNGSVPTLAVAMKIAAVMDTTVEDLWGHVIEDWKDERRN